MSKSLLNKSEIIIALALILAANLMFGNSALGFSRELYQQPFLGQIHALSLPKTDRTVTIALIDQGIDWRQEDLAATDDGLGQNFLSGLAANELSPQGSHATQIAGIIQATAFDNPNIKLMNLIACRQTDGCQTQAIATAVVYAVNHGARVINLSLGATGAQSFLPQLSQAITYAYQHQVVIVAAAGNGDSQARAIDLTSHPLSPVCNDNGLNMVLGVSAVGDNNQPTPWANFGNCVDVVAPGENLYTTLDPDYNHNAAYAYKSGTSYSAAIVSALAAEVLLVDPAATAAQVNNLISANASPLAVAGYGNGVVNIAKTLKVAEALTLASTSLVVTASFNPVKHHYKIPVVKKLYPPLYIRGPY